MSRLTTTSQATVSTMNGGAQSIRSMPPPVLVRSTEAVRSISPDINLSGLVPPQGALFGTATLPIPAFQWQLGPWLVSGGQGALDNEVDDKLLWNRSQTTNCTTQTVLYVYWVNGGSNPYYCVIAASSGTMSPGSIQGGSNNGSCDGFFQYAFTVNANIININNAPPPTSGWSLAASSPSSQTQDSATAQIQIALDLYAQTGSGMGSMPFNAGVDDTTPFASWQVIPAPGASGTNGTQWQYQQYSPWAPGVLEQFAYSQAACFNSGGVVIPSACAFGSVFYEAYTVWFFNPPLFTVPANPQTTAPSLPVEFGFSWAANFADIHDPTGCNGAYGYNGYHLYNAELGSNYQYTYDLGQIVNPQPS